MTLRLLHDKSKIKENQYIEEKKKTRDVALPSNIKINAQAKPIIQQVLLKNISLLFQGFLPPSTNKIKEITARGNVTTNSLLN